MSTLYAGNPNNYPTAVPVPDGSDVPTSTLFATAYEGDLDRTAYLAALLRALPAVNWRNPNAQPSNGITSFTQWLTAHWDSITNQWAPRRKLRDLGLLAHLDARARG